VTHTLTPRYRGNTAFSGTAREFARAPAHVSKARHFDTDTRDA
jgi:hypothetical protein